MKDIVLAVMLSASMFIETLMPKPVPIEKGVVLFARQTGHECVYTVRRRNHETLTMQGPCNLHPGDSVAIKMTVLH